MPHPDNVILSFTPRRQIWERLEAEGYEIDVHRIARMDMSLDEYNKVAVRRRKSKRHPWEWLVKSGEWVKQHGRWHEPDDEPLREDIDDYSSHEN